MDTNRPSSECSRWGITPQQAITSAMSVRPPPTLVLDQERLLEPRFGGGVFDNSVQSDTPQDPVSLDVLLGIINEVLDLVEG
jgi:hypothetical protein